MPITRTLCSGSTSPSSQFRSALEDAIEGKIAALQSKIDLAGRASVSEAEWFVARLRDDLTSLAEHLVELRQVPDRLEATQRISSFLRIMRGASVHPWSVRAELAPMLEALAARPSLTDLSAKARGLIGGYLQSLPRPAGRN